MGGPFLLLLEAPLEVNHYEVDQDGQKNDPNYVADVHGVMSLSFIEPEMQLRAERMGPRNVHLPL